MYYEKNIAKSICHQKYKDIIKVRLDMECQGIKEHLWLTKDPKSVTERYTQLQITF